MQWAECWKWTAEGLHGGPSVLLLVWASWATAARARKARSSRALPVGLQCFQQLWLHCTPTQKSSAVQPPISSLLPSFPGQWNKINWKRENTTFFFFLFFPLTRSSPLCSVCLSFSLLELELNAWNDYEKWYWIILRAKLFVSEWRGWIFLELPVLLVYIKSTLHKIECLHKVQELEKS